MTKKSMAKNLEKGIRLRCFVAIAFNREDTDAIYDSHIKKAIEEANLIPIRIDRITYIDRVDAKIRKEITDADLLVADLTYARPSVYWEAGYAERKSPVIYTCRADHFKQQDGDEFGNLAVHFDLQNANIISWNKVGDRSFHKKLLKTLNFAAKPLREQRGLLAIRNKARSAFSQASLKERRRTVSP